MLHWVVGHGTAPTDDFMTPILMSYARFPLNLVSSQNSKILAIVLFLSGWGALSRVQYYPGSTPLLQPFKRILLFPLCPGLSRIISVRTWTRDSCVHVSVSNPGGLQVSSHGKVSQV
jgi:hypothetical protein